jgi:alpha-1,2-glucosyltransferase
LETVHPSLAARLTGAFRTRDLPVLLSVLWALFFGLLLFADNGRRVDEQIHFDQINKLVHGPAPLNPVMTMLPGYHVLVALFIRVSGLQPEFGARLGSFLLSVATVVTFYLLAKAMQPESAGTRLLQFTFLPILFPQFFLIYTDVTAMLFVLLMMHAAVRGRYQGAGLFGLASCLIRQNNIVWVLFVMVWSYLRDNGWTWMPACFRVAAASRSLIRACIASVNSATRCRPVTAEDTIRSSGVCAAIAWISAFRLLV